MVFKTWSVGDSSYYNPPRQSIQMPRAKQEGEVIALVGSVEKGRSSTVGENESIERLYTIDNEILGYNLDANKVLLRCKKNDSQFDMYIALPFTKGVTEKATGRTLLILGSNAHHIEAMQGQFEGVVWDKRSQKEIKKYGETVRWINVGDTKSGFIGLDYNPAAKEQAGVATSMQDVKFLAQALVSLGYDANKRLFLLSPPYINERVEGKTLRKNHIEKLSDFASRNIGDLERMILT